MTYHSNPVAEYFSTTKHVVAPMVYSWLRMLMHMKEMDGNHGVMKITLREIAFLVGSNRMSVSRALRLLRQLGAVQYKRQGRGIAVEKVMEELP